MFVAVPHVDETPKKYMSYPTQTELVSSDSQSYNSRRFWMRPLFSVTVIFGLAVMFFSVIPARAFHMAPQCAGSFGYGSDGKPHCDVGKFNAAKKAGKKYKYDPATAGNLKNQKNR